MIIKILIAHSILVHVPRNVRPGLANMLRPSMRTLKHIVVNIHFYDGDDPLSSYGILSMFEDMRSKNIIETVTILFCNCRDVNRLKDDWVRLDEVLTSTGWFSLKRVSLTIDIVSLKGSKKELNVALRKLLETHCWRLSSSNSISFDPMVTTDS